MVSHNWVIVTSLFLSVCLQNETPQNVHITDELYGSRSGKELGSNRNGERTEENKHLRNSLDFQAFVAKCTGLFGRTKLHCCIVSTSQKVRISCLLVKNEDLKDGKQALLACKNHYARMIHQIRLK